MVERGQRRLLCQIDISKFATGVECTLADARGTISQGYLGQRFTTLKYPARHFLDILREGKRAQRVAVQECPVTQRRDGFGQYSRLNKVALGERITADGLDTIAEGDAGHHIIVVESKMSNGFTGVGNNHWRVSLMVIIEGVVADGLHLFGNIHVQQFIVLTETTAADVGDAVGQHSLLQVTTVIERIILQTGYDSRDCHLRNACPTEGVCPNLGNARRNVNMCQTQVRPVVLTHSPFPDFLGPRR